MPENLNKITAWIRKPNIAEDIDDDTLGKIANQVIEDFETDKQSMEDWERHKSILHACTRQHNRQSQPDIYRFFHEPL